MTLGQKIFDLVERMMFSAKLDSPRFDDYQIYAVESDPGLVKAIDIEVEKLSPKKDKQQDWHVKTYESYLKTSQGMQSKSAFQKLLANDLGASKAASTMGLLRDPKSFLFKIITSSPLRMIPIVMAVLAIPTVIDTLNRLLFTKGGPFDRTFRYTINTLNNQFREREQWYSIQAGFTQVITTTNGGNVNPRDSYNSYDTETHDIAQFQNIRQINQVGNIN